LTVTTYVFVKTISFKFMVNQYLRHKLEHGLLITYDKKTVVAIILWEQTHSYSSNITNCKCFYDIFKG